MRNQGLEEFFILIFPSQKLLRYNVIANRYKSFLSVRTNYQKQMWDMKWSLNLSRLPQLPHFLLLRPIFVATDIDICTNICGFPPLLQNVASLGTVRYHSKAQTDHWLDDSVSNIWKSINGANIKKTLLLLFVRSCSQLKSAAILIPKGLAPRRLRKEQKSIKSSCRKIFLCV